MDKTNTAAPAFTKGMRVSFSTHALAAANGNAPYGEDRRLMATVVKQGAKFVSVHTDRPGRKSASFILPSLLTVENS